MKQFLMALQAGLVQFAIAMSGSGWANDTHIDPAAEVEIDKALSKLA